MRPGPGSVVGEQGGVVLLSAERTPGGHREYAEAAVARVQRIQELYAMRPVQLEDRQAAALYA